MRTLSVIAPVCLLAAVLTAADQKPDPITAAAEVLGTRRLNTLQMNGLGATYTLGQSPSTTEPWPRVQVKSYRATVNYEASAMLVDMTREMGAIPPRGGGVRFIGEQRQIQGVVGATAWNVMFAAPGRSGPGRGVATEQVPQLAPASVIERTLQIWMTPHGFLKAAMANHAAAEPVADGTRVSFVLDNAFPFSGFINSAHEVEWVRTAMADAVLGDMVVEATYSNYQKSDGILFPMRVRQSEGGHPTLDLWLSTVNVNRAADIAVPGTIGSGSVPPTRVESTRVADGVYYLTGVTHHSVAIEMRDHVVVVEAPLDEARSRAVIGQVRAMVPDKPIRFVVNTHHHFDHAGGLRTYVSEGVTVVTQEANRAYYETAWSKPRTLGPDALSRSMKAPRFETFDDTYELTDGGRTIRIYRIANSPHDRDLAMVYMPKEQILIEADAYTPSEDPPASEGPSPAVDPATRNLYQNIQRLKLAVATIVPLHGPRLATMPDLARAAGREAR
jgi:glyoxylase-like metal-dependent hydrolase (beta-lactamase superfamily II)